MIPSSAFRRRIASRYFAACARNEVAPLFSTAARSIATGTGPRSGRPVHLTNTVTSGANSNTASDSLKWKNFFRACFWVLPPALVGGAIVFVIIPTYLDNINVSPLAVQPINVPRKPISDMSKESEKSFLIPPISAKREGLRTVVLDLDDTLAAMFTHDALPYHNIMGDRYKQTHRPFLKEFLLYCYAHYEVVLWTAGTLPYAIDSLEKIKAQTSPGAEIFDHVIARDTSWFSMSNTLWYEKRLELLGRPLDRVIMFENAPVVVPSENCVMVCDYDHPVQPKLPDMGFLAAEDDHTLQNAIALLQRWEKSPLPAGAFLKQESESGRLKAVYDWCILEYVNRPSVTIRGLRGTDVFLQFKNVTEAVLEDIEINMTGNVRNNIGKMFIERDVGDIHPLFRLYPMLFFQFVSRATITSSRIRGSGANMIQGCLIGWNSNMSIINTSFYGCRSPLTGALEVFHGHADIHSTNISNSQNGQSGGSLGLHGSASVVSSNLRITNSFSNENGGSIALYDNSTMSALNLEIQNSTCDNVGGAIFLGEHSIMNLYNVTIVNVSSRLRGGGIVLEGNSTLTLEKALISGARSQTGGCVSQQEATQGTFNFVTFEGCVATTGAVVFQIERAYSKFTNVTMRCDGNASQRCAGGDVWWVPNHFGMAVEWQWYNPFNASLDFMNPPTECYMYLDEMTRQNHTCLPPATLSPKPAADGSVVVPIARTATRHVRTVLLASTGLSIATQALLMDATWATSFAAGALVARMSAIDDVAQCDGGTFPEPSVDPTQVSLAGGPLAPYLGAIVMNTVLVVAFQLLFVGVFRSLETFPGNGLYLLLYMYLTQLRFSVRIVWDERRQWFHACSGVAVAVACVAFFCGVAWLVRTKSFLTTKRWRPLFDSYVPHRHYFALVELSSQAFTAVATAYLTSDRNICTTQAVACAAISIFHLVARVVLSPYKSYVHLAANCAVDVVAFVGSVLAALGRYENEGIVSFVGMLLVLVVIVYDGVQTLMPYWRACMTASGTQVPEVATEMKNASALEHALVSHGPSPPTHDMPPPPPTRTVKLTPQLQQQDIELDSAGVPPPKKKKKIIIDDTL